MTSNRPTDHLQELAPGPAGSAPAPAAVGPARPARQGYTIVLVDAGGPDDAPHVQRLKRAVKSLLRHDRFRVTRIVPLTPPTSDAGRPAQHAACRTRPE